MFIKRYSSKTEEAQAQIQVRVTALCRWLHLLYLLFVLKASKQPVHSRYHPLMAARGRGGLHSRQTVTDKVQTDGNTPVLPRQPSPYVSPLTWPLDTALILKVRQEQSNAASATFNTL